MTATKKSAGSGAAQELALGVKVGETPPPRDHVTPVTGPVSSGSALMKSEQRVGGSIQAAPDGSTASVFQLMQQAIEKGTDPAALEKLMDLAERVTKREAALEFHRALAAFQAECPPIGKVKEAKIATKSGGSYSYTFAPLEEIARVVKPLLLKHGFSYGWDSTVTAGQLSCACTLRHINGHSTSANFTLPTENTSAMSPQQKVGAALTFAQRKTLESVLGLNTTEEDTDAIAREVDPTPITSDQLLALEDMVLETEVDLPRFLKYLEVAALKDLPAARYQQAVAALNEKKTRRAK